MKEQQIKFLKEIVGQEKVVTDLEDKICYGFDSTRLEFMPDAIVRVNETSQISRIMRFANENSIPVTPRGAATGLSGGCLTVNGGISLVMVEMDKILSVNNVDLLAEVQAGAVTIEVDKAANKYGLFYPPDPGSLKTSTIGGNIAENAGGLRGLKYGVTKDYVNSLELVLPTGEVINVGAVTVKSVVGYNLVDLIVGSEGTLAIVTKATLGLLPVPPARVSMLATFEQMTQAAKTVRDIVAGGVITATLEFIDNVTINAIEDYLKMGLDRTIGAMLLIEVDGQKGAVDIDAQTINKVCKLNNCITFKKADSAAERDALWSARRAALSSLARVRPSTILEDATVPRSRIVELVGAVNKISQKYSLMIGTFGHAGDGNLHPTILTDLRDKEEEARVQKAIEEIFVETIKLDGTLSGEHGIGLTKAKFLKLEISEDVYRLMKNIKKTFDPNNILNPGKLFLS